MRENAERIGLFDAEGREAWLDAVLVQRALAEAGHEALPDARRLARLERVFVGIPIVEVADHAYRVGVRRPDRKHHAWRAVNGNHVCPELVVDPDVRPFVEEVQVEVS